MAFAQSSYYMSNVDLRIYRANGWLADRVARLPSFDNLETAEAVWGKPSNFVFQMDPYGYLAHLPNQVNLWPVSTDNASDDKKDVFHYTEISRETKKRRVTNPKDSNQYVDVEDATSILFQGDDGKLVQLDFADQGS